MDQNTRNELLKLFKSKLSDAMRLYLETCTRCGVCTEACHVYASTGGQGLVLACVDVRSGEIRWRKRGFEKANLIQAGELTILLDADGQLALARLSPEGMTVLSRATVSDGITWTAPTLVATTLYIRDQRTIRALDLSAAEEARN